MNRLHRIFMSGLVCITFAAIGCGKSGPPPGIPGPFANGPKSDADKLEDIARKHNGIAPAMFNKPDNLVLTFSGNHDRPDDAELKEIIGELKAVETPITLVLDERNQLTPVGYDAIADAPCVTRLNILSEKRSLKAMLPEIAKLKRLERLKLFDNTLADQDIALLAGLTNLRILWLYGGDGLTKDAYRHLTGMTQLEEFKSTINERKFFDADLVHVGKLTKLKKLDLGGDREGDLTDAGIAHLKGMTGLEELGFQSANLTGASLDVIASLPSLQSLQFYGGSGSKGFQFQPADFARLLPLKDRLRTFKCLSNRNDAFMEPIGKLAALETLDLTNCNITDVGVAHLAGLAKLKNLVLASNPITDAGLKHLAASRDTLETLELGSTNITDASIPLLKSMPKLNIVFVTQSKMTPAGITDLKQSRKWGLFYPN